MRTLERPSIRTKALPLPDVSLTEAREKYRALFESNMIGIAVSDLDERLLEANDAFLNVIGYTREDFLAGRVTWSAITPPEYATLDRKKVRELLRRGSITPFEKRYICKDGREIPVLVGAARMRIDPPRSVCFALDISESKKLEQKKDEFIGTVSHELQTPLAVLKMQIGLLRNEVATLAGAPVRGAQLERAINEIDEQVNRLSVLITDLLNLARYTGGERSSRETFDLSTCAQKVVADARLISGRRIIFKKARGACFVTGSERHIARVITNLLMNALRYSPETSRIIVSIETDGKRVRARVQDFGVGIEAKNIPKIFERFYRVERAGSRARGSSGIGLYVANEIAKTNNGAIEVESTPGKGSTFSLVLPLASLASKEL